LAGFVLSPIYALSTSFYLSRTKASRASGLVFAFSGLGGAALPWATGAISAHQHSLYWGLVVPLAGTVFLFAQSLYSVFRLAPALAVQAVADENATPLLGP
jgi:fucose permease